VAAAEETRRRSSRMVSTRVRRPSQKRSSEEGLQSTREEADSIGGSSGAGGQRLVFCFVLRLYWIVRRKRGKEL
jgi:hypothetical protein